MWSKVEVQAGTEGAIIPCAGHSLVSLKIVCLGYPMKSTVIAANDLYVIIARSIISWKF